MKRIGIYLNENEGQVWSTQDPSLVVYWRSPPTSFRDKTYHHCHWHDRAVHHANAIDERIGSLRTPDVDVDLHDVIAFVQERRLFP
jgi:hypothetical protein